MEQLFLFIFPIIHYNRSMNINQNSNKTVLIFGVSSFVGSNMADFFKKTHRVVGTYYQNPVNIKGVLSLECNVLNKDEIQKIMLIAKPDFVIYCVGISSVKNCDQLPHQADVLNNQSLYTVSEFTARHGARFIYLSNDFVFSGQKKNYNEGDNVDPVTHLGKTLANAEFYLQKSSLNFLIIRTSRLYGRGISAINLSWFEKLERALFSQNAIEMDDSIKFGFIDIYYVCMVLKMMMDKNIQNRLVHVSSIDQLTFFEFAQKYASEFKLSKSLINKTRWSLPLSKSVSVEEIRDSVLKLEVTNLESLLRIQMPSIGESLQLTHERLLAKSYDDPQEGLTLVVEDE